MDINLKDNLLNKRNLNEAHKLIADILDIYHYHSSYKFYDHLEYYIPITTYMIYKIYDINDTLNIDNILSFNDLFDFEFITILRSYLTSETLTLYLELKNKYYKNIFAVATLLSPISNRLNNELSPFIIELSKSILRIKNEDNVLHIGCYQGNFLLASCLDVDATYTGVESNSLASTITKIKSDLMDCNLKMDNNYDCFLVDFYSNYVKYDKILSGYPYIIDFTNNSISRYLYQYLNNKNIVINKKISLNWYFIYPIIDLLRENGKAVYLIPSICLSNKKDKTIRSYLVNSNYLDTIINLPDTLYPNEKTKLSLIIISKNNTSSVTMIDATSLSTNKIINSQSYYQHNYKEIIDSLLNTSNNSIQISYDKILANDVILSYENYL